jgi:hypothetical protein
LSQKSATLWFIASSNGFVPQQVIDDLPEMGALPEVALLIMGFSDAWIAIVLSDQWIANKSLITGRDRMGTTFCEAEPSQDGIFMIVKIYDTLYPLSRQAMFARGHHPCSIDRRCDEADPIGRLEIFFGFQ